MPPSAHRPVAGHPRAAKHADYQRLKHSVTRFLSKTAKELIQETERFQERSARFVQDRLKIVLGIQSRHAAQKPLQKEKI
jgi:hypothetical protein